MRRPVQILIVATVCLHWMLHADARPREKRSPRIRSVRFEGNKAFSDAQLERVMLSRPSAFPKTNRFNGDVFREDLRNLERFYRQNGYLEMRVANHEVREDTARNRVRIVIEVEERSRTITEGVGIFGNAMFPDSVLAAGIPLRKGDPFGMDRVESASVGILRAYADEGYLDARVEPGVRIDSVAHRALVDFTVFEGVRYGVGVI